MRCPRCQCTQLKLGIVFAGEVACTFRDGEVVEVLDAGALESYWSEDSSCQCIHCGWSGHVRDVRPASQPRVRGRSNLSTRPKDRLAELERMTAQGSCPKSIQKDVQQLIGMIRRLQKQVQILETVQRASDAGRISKESDTVVF